MDKRTPLDRPRAADTTPDAVPHRDELWVLAQRLEAQRFGVELTDQGLVVHLPPGQGCGVPVTVTCRARADDVDRLWFFASSGKPIAEAARIPDAVLAIRTYLAGERS